jgi:hypothetical protein
MSRRAAGVSLGITLSWALGALAGCDKSGPDPDPTGPAGKVVELAGTVTAVRAGGDPRTLTPGAEVFADDTVTTSADGSATILLAHNQVSWSLGAGQSRRVDRSMAWSAAVGSGSQFDERGEMVTASAGRHTEREAGETGATALGPETPPASELPAVPAEDAPEKRVTEAPTRRETRAKVSQPRRSYDPGPARAERTPPMDLELGIAPKPPSGDGAAASTDSPAEVKTRWAAKPKKGSAATGSAGAKTPAAPAPSAAPSEEAAAPAERVARGVLGTVSVEGRRTREQIQSSLRAIAQACTSSAAGTAVLRVEIDGAGQVKKVQVTLAAGMPSRVSECLTRAARAQRFLANTNATSTVRAEIRFPAP